MGLIARIRHRVGYVWYWRVRYWWMDTREGIQARVTMAVLGLIGVIGMSVRLFFVARASTIPGQPHEAIIGVVVYLIIALLVAAIALATMPKPKPPQPQTANTPTTQDGQSVQDHGGTFWVDDSFILAWKQMPAEPIRTSGGKK